jgi:uncharacterized repeat protein (TIGR02059 family)
MPNLQRLKGWIYVSLCIMLLASVVFPLTEQKAAGAGANAAPVISALTPAHQATDVSVSTQLELEFDRLVYKGENGTVVTLLRTADQTSIRIPVHSPDVTVAGQKATVKIPQLAYGTEYEVRIDPKAFVDASGEYFAGITKGGWKFKTIAGQDTDRPTIVSVYPANGSAQVGLIEPLVITFSEAVYPGKGDIVIKRASDHSVVTSVPVTSSLIQGAGSAKITVNHTAKLEQNTSYYVQIGPDAFLDEAGNAFYGISDTWTWTFRTVEKDQTPPYAFLLEPADNSSNVALDSRLKITFNEEVTVNPRVSSPVRIHRKDGGGSIPAQIEINPLNKREAILVPQSAFAYGQAYYVEIPADLFLDLSGNPYPGMLNEEAWRFTTVGLDQTPPNLVGATLTNGTSLQLKYNEPLDPRSTPSPAQFAVHVDKVSRPILNVYVSGSSVILSLQSPALPSQAVTVSYTRGARPIRDLSGNAAADFSGKAVTHVNDTTQPVVESAAVTGNQLVLTYSKPLNAVDEEVGRQFTVQVNGYAVAIARTVIQDRTITFYLESAVTESQIVTISYAAGANPVRDLAGNFAPNFSQYPVRNSADTRPPELVQATVNRNELKLKYNEGLLPASVPNRSDYAVVVDGSTRSVSKISIAGTEVILTLSTSVREGQSVVISYLPNTSPVMDLALNPAPYFSNYYVINITDTTAPQLSGATAAGNSIVLTYSKTLDSSSVPSASQYYVTVNGKPASVVLVTVSGTQVTLSLNQSVTAGDRISVTYSTSGTPLKDTNGNVAARLNRHEFTAGSNPPSQTPPPQTQLPGNVNGVVALDTSKATAVQETSMSGLSVKRYRWDDATISAALESLRTDNYSNAQLQLVIPETESAARVTLGLLPLEAGSKAVPGAELVLRHGTRQFAVPLSVIDYAELQRQFGTNAGSIQLELQMEPIMGNTAAATLRQFKISSSTALSDPIAYTIQAVSGGRTIPLSHFSDYIAREFWLPMSVNPREATVVAYDRETGQAEFVPALFKAQGNGTLVTVKHRGTGTYIAIADPVAFSDMEKHWSSSDVAMMAGKRIVEGKTSRTFAPNQPITREEFAVFVAKALGLSGNSSAANFSDVRRTGSSAPYIGAAAEAGIVLGHPDGTFRPNQTITREEMAVMIHRALEYAGKQDPASSAQPGLLTKFRDRQSISSWAQASVARAVYAGIIQGSTKDLFKPKDPATRAEATVMLKRMLMYIGFING